MLAPNADVCRQRPAVARHCGWLPEGRTIVAACLLVGAALTTTAPAGADPPDLDACAMHTSGERVVLDRERPPRPCLHLHRRPRHHRVRRRPRLPRRAGQRARRQRRGHRGAHAGRRVDARRTVRDCRRRRLPQRHPRPPEPAFAAWPPARSTCTSCATSSRTPPSAALAAWGSDVDGYVSEVTIRRNTITGAGSTGIYLEAGSRRNVVAGNVLHDNGFGENSQGTDYVVGTQTFPASGASAGRASPSTAPTRTG